MALTVSREDIRVPTKASTGPRACLRDQRQWVRHWQAQEWDERQAPGWREERGPGLSGGGASVSLAGFWGTGGFR